jgi:hypothetical protein
MKKLLRVALVSVFTFAAAVTLQADCANYECTVGPDSAQCWVRYGPNARRFPIAAACNERCDCMPDIGTGQLYCSCYCSLDYCYSA